MKVLIDDGLSTLQQLGGIGYFSVNLWKHVKKYVDCDITDYHYLSSLPRVAKRVFYVGLANLEPCKRKYDVIHYQNYYIPRFLGRTKSVATIHDMGGLKSPDVYPVWYNIYFRKILYNTIRRSNAITLSSYAAKEELFSLFPRMDESRVHVCHHGIRSIFFESLPTEKDLQQLELRPYSFFLFIGNLEKRKNLSFLLSQFIAARKHHHIAQDTKLVLVGKLGIGYKDIQHLISEQENIIYLGRLSDDKLVSLYRFCKAFIFPSLYEGFGIPIIEAMSQKAPILISNIPPSLELHRRHNNQCFVFELDNKAVFAERLSYLDKNYASIAAQLDYGDLSIYSYDRVAQEHIKIYTHVLQD